MTKRAMPYDHPQYLAHEQLNASLSGSGGVGRFAVFTDARAKSVTLKPSTGGTSNDITTLVAIDGTTTSTLATATFGSGATAGTNIACASNVTVSTNGYLQITKGTDATLVLQAAIELEVVPRASVEVF